VPDRGRPALRGWLHAVAVPFALVGLWLLGRAVGPLALPQRVPAVLYGLALVLLFATSAVYHVPRRWTPAARARLVRLDGVATVLLIVGTFVPVAAYALDGAWRWWSLVGAAVLALGGGALAGSSVAVRPRLAAAAYVLAGWVLVIPLARAVLVLPSSTSALLVLGGVLYSVGAVVFARRRPDPIPGWFGYHEVFHVLVTAAAVVHFVAVLRGVVPLAT
jgi:hemolysin III